MPSDRTALSITIHTFEQGCEMEIIVNLWLMGKCCNIMLGIHRGGGGGHWFVGNTDFIQLICPLVPQQSKYLLECKDTWWKLVAWAEEQVIDFWTRSKSQGGYTNCLVLLLTLLNGACVLNNIYKIMLKGPCYSFWGLPFLGMFYRFVCM